MSSATTKITLRSKVGWNLLEAKSDWPLFIPPFHSCVKASLFTRSRLSTFPPLRLAKSAARFFVAVLTPMTEPVLRDTGWSESSNSSSELRCAAQNLTQMKNLAVAIS